jgi:GTP 3',8-cyclase
MHENVSVAILCGGRSSRLGSDKGLFRPLGEKSLVSRMIARMGDHFGEILIVCKNEEQADLYREELNGNSAPLRIVCDSDLPYNYKDAALCGVATAVASAKNSRCLVFPVDQIGLRFHIANKLLQPTDSTKPACFTLGGDHFPFPAVFSKTHLPRIRHAIEVGALSVRHLLEDLNATVVDGQPFAADLEANGNTHSDYENYFGTKPLFDPHGRRMLYLRLSVTEACNMACQYCLPKGFPEWYRHKARMDLPTLTTMLTAFRQMGFEKVRFTGGEPTVFPQLKEAITRARVLGFEEICMTTNGLLINDLESWLDAGLTQINVSMDTLDPKKFQTITGSKDLQKVLNVIDDACALGLKTKVNTVLLRSSTYEDIPSLLDWALCRPLTLRFIELMPTGLNMSFHNSERVDGSEIAARLHSLGLAQSRINNPTAGPETVYSSPEHVGKIGLINPISCNFCDRCNRLRITARGELKLCLFGQNNLPLDLSSTKSVDRGVRQAIEAKRDRHYLEKGEIGNVATFRTIGG